MSVERITVARVEDYEWQIQRNVFLQNQQRYEFIKQQQFDRRIRQNSQKVETILETLPIEFRIETVQNQFQIGNFIKNQNNSFGHSFKKNIYPSSYQVSLDIPFLVIDLSLVSILHLSALIQVWLSASPNVFRSRPSQVEDSSREEEGEDEAGGEAQYGLNHAQKQSAKLKRAHNLHQPFYESYIKDIFESLVLSQIDIRCNGVKVNLNIDDGPGLKRCAELEHSNNLLSVIMMDIELCQTEKYFTTEQSIRLGTLLVQNSNCYKFDIKRFLMQKSIEQLSHNDFTANLTKYEHFKQYVLSSDLPEQEPQNWEDWPAVKLSAREGKEWLDLLNMSGIDQQEDAKPQHLQAQSRPPEGHDPNLQVITPIDDDEGDCHGQQANPQLAGEDIRAGQRIPKALSELHQIKIARIKQAADEIAQEIAQGTAGAIAEGMTEGTRARKPGKDALGREDGLSDRSGG